MREIWNRIGKQAYLEMVHPLVISNLYAAPHKSSASAASVLLIGSSEELGVPITVHQVKLFSRFLVSYVSRRPLDYAVYSVLLHMHTSGIFLLFMIH